MLNNAIKTRLINTFNFTDTRIKASDLELDEEASDLEQDEEASDNSYTYYADTLNKDIQKKEYESVQVCVYKINTQELHPFIMFLLYKNDDNDLNFYSIDGSHNGKDIISDTLNKLRNIFNEEETAIEYKGFIEDNGKLVLIIKHNSEKQQSIKHVTYDSRWWWALASEIINYKTILNFKINKFATNFLIEHNQLIFLRDGNGNIYETPEIGYYGNYYKKIAAVASLGLSRQGPYSSFGPFYYFSDYTHAMRNAFWTLGFKPKEVSTLKTGTTYITIDDKGRYEKGGIVKFALFSGKTKMLMGRKLDIDDDSSISMDLAETNDFVKAMLKLRDNSAKWTKEYNSIRIGSHTITLPGKPDIHTNPMIALKEYEQQVPLEYYFVDTSQDVEEKNINTAIIS